MCDSKHEIFSPKQFNAAFLDRKRNWICYSTMRELVSGSTSRVLKIDPKIYQRSHATAPRRCHRSRL